MVSAARLRVVFFGTPAFAVPTLEALLASSHSVVAVVTQPDRPRGRGHKVLEGAVKVRARAAGLEVLQPSSLKAPEFLDQLRALRSDLGVVAAYGKILTDTVLAIPRLGMINVHASLLPRYRGAAPIQRAIAAGETETGVTIMRVIKALDAGAMLATVRRTIGPDDLSEDVERDLARLGASALVGVVDRLAEGPVLEVPQDDGLATYAARLTKEDGVIDWAQPARRIRDLVRGMRPWPHASSHVDGVRLIVLRATVDETPHEAPPGTVIAARGDELRVATGRGILVIRELQAEGKRPMTVREFLAGHRLAPGDRFVTP